MRNSISYSKDFTIQLNEMPLFQEFNDEYTDLFEEIFLLSEKQFLNKLIANVNVMSQSLKNFSKMIQAKVISSIKGRLYMPDIKESKKIKDIMASLGSKDEIKRLNRLELSVITPHCHHTSKAYHICHNELLRPQLTDVDYVVCLQCKMIYKPEQIHLYCKECDMEYYSAIKNENQDNEGEFSQATWEVYHCKGVVDAKMRCPQCREVLYYDKNKGTVICKNCGFCSNPKKIPFKCKFCKEIFYSRAKEYNELIYKPMIMNIKKAMIEKIPARPFNVPCCDVDLKTAIFKHKRECTGVLYLGNVNGNKIVVCSECKTVNYYKKNIWFCPKCDKKFKVKERDILDDDENLSKKSTNSSSKEVININENKPKEKEKINGNSGKQNVITEINENNKRGSIVEHENLLENKNNINNAGNTKNYHKRISMKIIQSYTKKEDYIEIIQMKTEPSVNKNSIIPRKSEVNLNSNNNSNRNNKCSSHHIKLNNGNLLNKIHKNLIEPTEHFNIKDFTFCEQIGEGSFGKIYKVVYINNNEPYAMKKILAKTEEEQNTMKKEYELEMSYSKTKKGIDTGIIKVYGVQKTKEVQSQYGLYVLMELASTDWEKEIQFRGKQKKYYNEGELFQILKRVVRTMAALEDCGIAHRDIKPQNILIVNNCSYKICDFGEAKKVDECERYQEVRGTELYMSPLLFNALKNKASKVEHNCFKSDVFSLGLCMIYASTLNIRTLCDIRELKDMESINNILVRYLIARYSSQYVEMLSKMIEIDEGKRMNFIEMEKILRD